MRLLLEINNNKSKDLPCSVVDSLCRWWWWWWCPCSSVDWCSSTIAVDGTVESLWLNVRNRYDPCALSSSFPFENTPFRPAVHTNTNNMSNAMILNTANIDDNCCRDRVVIFVSRSLSYSVCVCLRARIQFVFICFTFFVCLFALCLGVLVEIFDVLVFLQWITCVRVWLRVFFAGFGYAYDFRHKCVFGSDLFLLFVEFRLRFSSLN